MSDLASTPLDAFNTCVLELHRASRTLPLREYQAFGFTRLGGLVRFDSGLLATGTIREGVPHGHDVFLDRQGPELMASWEALKQADRISFATVAEPGRAMTFDVSRIYEGLPEVLAHCRRFSIAHVCSTAFIAPRAGTFVVLSLYRSDASDPFTEADRALVQLLVPHLVEGCRQAQLDALRRATHTPESAIVATAVANREAIVLEAEPAFIELLSAAYPDWNGPSLPGALEPLASVLAPERRVIGRLVFRAAPDAGLVLIQARTLLPVDTLSDREREVARRFASGDSAKEISERLGIANNTVRSHLGRIYEKLGVVNKAELASMLTGLD